MTAAGGAGGARAELLTTDGAFELDGGRWEVTNNVWLVGDDQEVLVIDAAHDATAIAGAVGGRRVVAIVLTHGHNDHINAAVPLRAEVGAPVYLHPADRMLWDAQYPGAEPDGALGHGQVLAAGGARLDVVHTPGHSPGSCCLRWRPDGDRPPVLFSGDTLFKGGPGATGRSYSDGPTILRSIWWDLMSLPATTVVHTGHGESTTVGDEREGVAALLQEHRPVPHGAHD